MLSQIDYQPNHSFRRLSLQHNLISIQFLNILFIIYNALTLASSSFVTYKMGITIPHFAILNLLFGLFMLFNIGSLLLIKYCIKKNKVDDYTARLERFIYFTIILATSWSTVISTLNQSTYKHLLVYTFTIVFCAAFFIIRARLFAYVVLFTSLALAGTILVSNLPLFNVVSLGLFLISLDVMTIVLAMMTYQTSKRSYDANTKLRQQYEINEELTKKLQFEAHYDVLTHMFNRRGFNQYIEKMSQFKTSRHTVAMVLIDIDYFKQYNDFYGHAKGDIVIKQVATVIMKVADEYGFITARWGGEEFIAIAQCDNEEEVKAFCAQLMEEVNHLRLPHSQSDVADYLTISVGSTIIHCNAVDNMKLAFDRADEALYIAKRRGRHQHYHLAKQHEETK